MREIKFRAWDEPEKWMGEVSSIDFEEGCLYMATRDDDDENKFDLRALPVMQYTGLKDKNGVEIYEGDVVRFVDFDTTGGHRDDREHTGIVKYQSGLYEIWENNESEYYGPNGAFILNFAWLQDDEFEVIGNIYENPELLEMAE